MFIESIKDISVSSSPVITKLAVGLIILLVSIVISRLLNGVFNRWHDNHLSNLTKKSPAVVASFETKVAISKRIVNSIIFFLAIIFVLLQFPGVRSIGTGLLASAGVAGIVIGMAAQNTLSNIIAGISISFAQPIRLQDAVILDGEFGWVEEITLMNTTIKTWDNRRIMVPNNVLVNKVIQNWTIKDPSLIGVVMLYVDYACDVERVRKWVKEIVDESAYSTKERVSAVQVLEFTEKTMQLRILGKGADAPNTFNLRCEIREKLIGKFKESGMPLPKFRIIQEPPIMT